MDNYENFWIVTMLRGDSGCPDRQRNPGGSRHGADPALSSVRRCLRDSVAGDLRRGGQRAGVCTSFFASLRPARAVLRLQSACGVVIGMLFCSILFDRIQLGWFLYLIAAQALATAYAEFTIARHTSRKHGSRWSYAAAGIALVCAVIYAIAAVFAPGKPDAARDRDSRLRLPGGVWGGTNADGSADAGLRAPGTRGGTALVSRHNTSRDVCDVRHGQLPPMHSLIVTRPASIASIEPAVGSMIEVHHAGPATRLGFRQEHSARLRFLVGVGQSGCVCQRRWR